MLAVLVTRFSVLVTKTYLKKNLPSPLRGRKFNFETGSIYMASLHLDSGFPVRNDDYVYTNKKPRDCGVSLSLIIVKTG
jgi:hypothetical protein